MITLVLIILAFSHNYHYYEQQLVPLFSTNFSNSISATHPTKTCLSIISLHFLIKFAILLFYLFCLYSFQVLYQLQKHLSTQFCQLDDHLAELLSNLESQGHNSLLHDLN